MGSFDLDISISWFCHKIPEIEKELSDTNTGLHNFKIFIYALLITMCVCKETVTVLCSSNLTIASFNLQRALYHINWLKKKQTLNLTAAI